MILLIDNYDSFTYNLYQYLGEINPDIVVRRNDKITIDEIKELKPTHIVISPGPGFPKDAGICIELIQKLSGQFPILGVCLGHQAIGEAFGAVVQHAQGLMHGKSSHVQVDTNSQLFRGLASEVIVGRYHSLIVAAETFPPSLQVTARSCDGEVMAMQHKEFPTFGIQFHPESILTPDGKIMLQNFLQVKK